MPTSSHPSSTPPGTNPGTVATAPLPRKPVEVQILPAPTTPHTAAADSDHIRTLTISPEDARDQALVMLASRGDQHALTELLTIHQDRVFAVCLRMTADRDLAEDLAQETLLRIIKSLDQFNHKAKFTTWLTRVAMNVCLTSFRRGKLRKTVSLDAIGDPGSTGTWAGQSGVFRAFGGDTFLGGILGRLFGGTSGGAANDGTSAGTTLNGKSNPGMGTTGSRRYTPGSVRERPAEERAELSESMQHLYAALAEIDPEQRALLVLRDMHGMDYHHIADILDVPSGTVKSRLFRARTALRQKYEEIVAQSGL
jgi:RNA polymerase sigma-70 factor (ECF subfamily)